VDPSSGRVEPPTSLLARLSSFLPQLQAANDALLSRVSAEGAEAVDIEHVEDESRGYIEMNVLIAEHAPGCSSGSEDDDDGDGGASGTGDSSGGEEDAGGEEEGFAVGLGAAAGGAGLRLPPSLQGGCAPAAKRSRKALIEVVAEAEGREGEAADAGGGRRGQGA